MKSKKYFSNKRCDICKGKAIMYRSIGGKGYMLCDKSLCADITEEKAGWRKKDTLDFKKYEVK